MNYAKQGGLLLAAVAWPGLAFGQVFDLGEIVVLPLATPEAADRTGASIEVVDEETLQRDGDFVLGEQLARLPGVNITRQGGPGTNADFQIRGANTRYVAVYIDGILVTDPSVPTIQYEDFGGFTIGNVNRVELLKGSQSALYGGTAVGGVLDVGTLGGADLGEGTHQELFIEGGSYGTIAGGYSLTQNTGDLSLSFGVSSVRSDGFSAADENDGNTEADGYDRTRVAGGATYELSDSVTIGANAFFETGTAEFDEFGPTDGATFNEVSNRDAFGARAFFAFEGPTYDNEFNLTWYQTDRLSSSDFGDFRARGDRLQATNVTSFAATDTIDLSVGLDIRHERSRTSSLPPEGETTTTYGAFVEGVYSPSDMVDIIATARLDSHSAFGEFLTGRLAFAYRPNGQTTYRGAIATGYRAPSISELFDSSAFFTGNPDLTPETSITAELGVDRALPGGGEVSATLFWGQIGNLITLTSDFSSVENVPGQSIRQGIELSGSLPVTDAASVYGAATFMEARAADGTPIPRVPTTDIVLGGTLDVSDRLTLNSNARYVAGLFDAGAYLPSFTVVNAGAEYALSDAATAYVRVENLFNEQYQTTTGYGTSDLAIYAGLRARF